VQGDQKAVQLDWKVGHSFHQFYLQFGSDL